LPWREAGVGAGLLGYEEYTVVQVEDATVTAWVTIEGVGAGGTVTPPYAAVAVLEGAVEDAALADELRLAPIWRAAFLKFVNELGAPSAPQFTANTIPAPQ